MSENNIENPSKKLLEEDEDFPDFQKIDPAFFDMMKKYYEETRLRIEPSPDLRERVLKAAIAHKHTLAKEGKLNNSDWLKGTKPIVNPIKDLREWFTLDGFAISNLRVVGALLIIVAIIGGLSYVIYQYQFTKNQNGIVTNQPTPLIKETPISTPTPKINATPTPFLAENNKKDDEKTNNESSPNNPNEQRPVIAKEKPTNSSPNKIKDKTPNNSTKDEQVAHNNTNNIPNIANVSKDVLRGVIVNLSLLEIKQFYITSFGDKENDKLLRQALIERLQNTDFEVLTASQALSIDSYGKIVKRGDEIQIINSATSSILWYKSIKSLAGSTKEVADNLVKSLLEDIKNQEKK